MLHAHVRTTSFSARTTDGPQSKDVSTWRFDSIIPPILDILPHLHLAAGIVYLIPLRDQVDIPWCNYRWKYKKNLSASNM